MPHRGSEINMLKYVAACNEHLNQGHLAVFVPLVVRTQRNSGQPVSYSIKSPVRRTFPQDQIATALLAFPASNMPF